MASDTTNLTRIGISSFIILKSEL